MTNFEKINNLSGSNHATILYTCDSADRIRIWGIWADNVNGKHGICYTDGLEDGKLKDPTFKEAKEKNVGKTNYMSPQAQALEMVKQEVGKKEKENYFGTPDKARALKAFRPMLCPSGMKWSEYASGGKKSNKVIYPALASPKFDGARCNIYIDVLLENIVTRTREGRDWKNFEHIRLHSALTNFLETNPNIILDGEMYNHDFKDEFESLMSVFRKEKPTETEKAESARVSKYFIYDIYDKNSPKLSALERQIIMRNIYEEFFIDCPEFVFVFSTAVENEAAFDKFHETCMDEGYEGTILRLSACPYGVESRSGELLKRKDVFDAEFVISGVFEGEGSKAGIAGGIIIDLRGPVIGMNINDSKKLDMTTDQKAGLARGWDDVKAKELLENAENYVGKHGTIEYFGITAYGKLRFPKFKALRHD